MSVVAPRDAPAPAQDRAIGMILALVTLAVVGREWLGGPLFDIPAAAGAAVVLGLIAPQVRWPVRIFVVVGLALCLAVALQGGDWLAGIVEALLKAAFIAAFFTALTSLRHSADTSPAITRCGRFLAEQPPGRRYIALTTGGHLFALLLNYGAIALLGSLAVASAAQEPNAELRGHRTRRMLLAIQRGFVSSLPWSPLAFSMAISTSLIPGATWAGAVLPCLVSAAIMVVLGWALDTIFKPRLSAPPPRRGAVSGSWALMLPLLALLALLTVAVAGLHLSTGIRAVGVVILVVPLMSAGWLMVQSPGRPLSTLAARTSDYLGHSLPGYRSELVLLMMAGFIGTLGALLLEPVIAASGLDLATLPTWAILMALVWGIPLAGQIGANPILAVALVAPILPDAAALGLTPSDIIVAITAGWALSGTTSPYTATTLLTGSFGGVSARHVGLRWNRGYVAVTGVALSAWVLLVAAV